MELSPSRNVGYPERIFLELESVRSHRCTICLSIVREAVFSGCKNQHVFCGDCIRPHFVNKSSDDRKCPNCNEKVGKQFYLQPAPVVDRMVKQAKVRCPHPITADSSAINERCDWKGELSTLESSHHKNCAFVTVKCKYCGDKTIMRKYWRNHAQSCDLTPHPCELRCGVNVIKKNMRKHLESECDMGKVTCRNDGCGEAMLRKDLHRHNDNKCQFAVVICKYAKYGCKLKGKRRDASKHESEFRLEHIEMKCTYLEKHLSKSLKKNEMLEGYLDHISVATLGCMVEMQSQNDIFEIAALDWNHNRCHRFYRSGGDRTKIEKASVGGRIAVYLDSDQLYALGRIRVPRACRYLVYFRVGCMASGEPQQNIAIVEPLYSGDKARVIALPDLDFHQSHCAVAWLPELGLVVSGGKDRKSDNDQLQWVVSLSMKGKGGGAGGGADERKIDDSNAYSVKADWLTWKGMPRMVYQRFNHSSVAIGNDLLVCGGDRNAQCEILNANSDVWSHVSSMIRERSTFGITYWKEKNSVIVAGGWKDNNRKSVETFDLVKNKWTELPKLNHDHRRNPWVNGSKDGRIVVMGDRLANDTQWGVVELWDPREGKTEWAVRPQAYTDRYKWKVGQKVQHIVPPEWNEFKNKDVRTYGHFVNVVNPFLS